MGRDIWESRDRPLLEAIAKADEAGHAVKRAEALFGLDELSDEQVMRGLRALYQDGLISGIDASTMGGFDLLEIEITGEGRRAVGQWPASGPYDALLAGLEARLAATADPGERSRLERFRDAVLGLGREVAGEVIADVLRRGGV